MLPPPLGRDNSSEWLVSSVGEVWLNAAEVIHPWQINAAQYTKSNANLRVSTMNPHILELMEPGLGTQSARGLSLTLLP
jgi:hypothetical protein